MIWTTVLFLITISILVAIHEFGHFWVARRCGVKVERFSIGFGPTIFKYQSKSDTEFALSIIPLGGYVKMLDSRVDEVTDEDKQYAFDQQSIAKRAAVVSAGPIANFILAFFIYWVIAQVGIVTYPVKIGQILPGSVLSSINIPQGSELKSIASIKVNDWRDVQLVLVGEIGQNSLAIEYVPTGQNTPVTKQVNIVGWNVNLDKEEPVTALGLVLQRLKLLPVLSEVMSGSAAEKAGLQAGDKIISYNGITLNNWDTFATTIEKGDTISLNVEREGKTLSLKLTPNMRTVTDKNGQTVERGFAGISPSSDVVIKQYNPLTAVWQGIEQTGFMIKVVVKSFYQLVTGALSLKNISGPVTIAKSADQSASYGIVSYLYFLAFISISLGVVNLIPLPMLDGGHLLFLLVEKIKGSPVSDQTQSVFYRIGFVLLMMIMGIALFNDFSR